MRKSIVPVLVGLTVLIAGVFVASDRVSAITGSQANVGNGKCWQNSAGKCYHWARTAPGLTLKVENDLTAAWTNLQADGKSYYTRSLADWSFTADPPATATVDSVSLNMIPQNVYSSSPSCPGLSGIVRLCDRKYGFNGWLGLASIWIASDGEHITAGAVKLNNSYFSSATYNTVAWRNLVSCQELAHTLGLGHEDENFNNANLNSCMDYTSSPASNQFPSSDDKLTLANMYLAADASSTVSAASATSNGNGQELGNDDDALPPGAGPKDGDVFVKHLSNGMTLVTHVFWVEKGNPR